MTTSGDRCDRVLRLFFVVAVLTLYSAGAPATATTRTPSPSPSPTCTPFPRPTLVFTQIDVDPPDPVVGDEVHIDVRACAGGGLFFFQLRGSNPYFTGETAVQGSEPFGIGCDNARFELEATASGTAVMTIDVSYEINIGCIDQPVFVFEYGESDPFEISIGVGTPRPTRSPTNTPTITYTRTPSPTAHPSITRALTPVTPLTHTPTATAIVELCPGDCSRDGSVTVDEVVVLIAIALGEVELSECAHSDTDGDGHITVDEVLAAVTSALDGCPLPEEPCGGIAGLTCPPGEACDLRDPTCSIADLAGHCVVAGDACPQIFLPVCGCDGVTYDNDCERVRAGAVLAHDGVCGVPIPLPPGEVR